MKISKILILIGLLSFAGCTTYVSGPVPVVYYGWYGDYYGYYYWDSSGIIVYGCPPRWHGHYYYGPHFYYKQGTPSTKPMPRPPQSNPNTPRRPHAHRPAPTNTGR